MRKRSDSIIIALIAAVIFVSGSSCWYYSFSGRSLPGINSVAIPLFTDRSLEFQLKDRLQLQLIRTFQEENILKIESPGQADAILNGTILRVEDKLTSITRDERAEQTEVHIMVEIILENRTSGEVIARQQLTGVGFYKDVSERDAAVNLAIEQLTRDIANTIMSGW